LDGFVVFRYGKVISAGTSRQDLQSMIFNFLVKVKKFPANEITELHTLFHENIRHYSNKLMENGYLHQEELTGILHRGIEDITCSIFNWKGGNYRFESIQNVDSFAIENFSISADAAIMEAARRLDESKRMGDCIKSNTVFVRKNMSVPVNKNLDPLFVLNNPPEYVYTLIDGTSPVELLCQESFLSEYQVYCALYDLLQNEKIIPLSDTLSLTIRTAVKKSSYSNKVPASKIILSAGFAAVFIASIYLFSVVLLKDIVFLKTMTAADNKRSELSIEKARQKVAIGLLHYQSEYGAKPLHTHLLADGKILSKRDMKWVNVE